MLRPLLLLALLAAGCASSTAFQTVAPKGSSHLQLDNCRTVTIRNGGPSVVRIGGELVDVGESIQLEVGQYEVEAEEGASLHLSTSGGLDFSMWQTD